MSSLQTKAIGPVRQAACYGRAFVPAGGFPRDGIVGVVRRLRLLNAMREPSVSPVPVHRCKLCLVCTQPPARCQRL